MGTPGDSASVTGRWTSSITLLPHAGTVTIGNRRTPDSARSRSGFETEDEPARAIGHAILVLAWPHVVFLTVFLTF